MADPDLPKLDTLAALRSRVASQRRITAPIVAGGSAQTVDHSRFARIVAAHADGWSVDYPALRRDPALAAYRQVLAEVDPRRLGRAEQLAFWINAYDASVLSIVAERWPVRSVLEIDGVFTALRFPVGRARMTLDEIEHGKVRRFGDPRVHFALSCGSVGCPPLAVYSGPGLAAELSANSRRYLADERRGARADGSRLLLTSVVKWFAGDFAPLGGSGRRAGLLAASVRPKRVLPAVRPFLPDELVNLRRVGFIDYDWSVNGR